MWASPEFPTYFIFRVVCINYKQILDVFGWMFSCVWAEYGKKLNTVPRQVLQKIEQVISKTEIYFWLFCQLNVIKLIINYKNFLN